MRIAAVQHLWLLLAVPVLVVGYVLAAARRRHQLERIGDAVQVGKLVTGLSPGRRILRASLMVLAVGLVAFALSRPQWGGRSRLVRKRGIDIVVALDFSKSMLARDVYPSRIERAKVEVARLIDSLGGDRVGLVAFAGEVVRYPLTTDYSAAKLFWRDLGPTDMPVGGTAIGRALTAATELLVQGRTGTPRPQWIVLLTDGEDTESEPIEAAREAGRQKIRIFAVGIGSQAGERVPTVDEDGRVTGWQEKPEGGYLSTRLDEAALRAVADASAGRYVRAAAGHFGIDEVASVIAAEHKSEGEQRLVTSYDEAYAYALWPAFVMLLAEACIGDRKAAWRPRRRRAEAA
jgi:Ca-activated chloride channel homolog